MDLLLDHHAALGTAWWVEVAMPPSEHLRGILRDALVSHISTFEARYSRFQKQSLVTQLNETGTIANPDPELLAIMRYGQSLFADTAGRFNFLIGNTLSARGYDASYRFTAHTTPETTLPNPLTDLLITDSKITLTAGSVDMGGYGKGYLIDELAALIRAHDVDTFLINGGGDLYGASREPLTVYLEHPIDQGVYLGTTTLTAHGFAASSPFKRRWRSAGTEHHHIVGELHAPAATFVKAATAATADAFATAALLMDDTALRTMADTAKIAVLRYTPETQVLTGFGLPFDYTRA